MNELRRHLPKRERWTNKIEQAIKVKGNRKVEAATYLQLYLSLTSQNLFFNKFNSLDVNISNHSKLTLLLLLSLFIIISAGGR